MDNTQNYDLNLYEGGDKFNPLLIDVPNFEKIDEVMKNNEIRSVGVATDTLTGTVHALTRETESQVFRFVANAPFQTGQTFTVDGVQVSALLSNGNPLSDGAFIIGTNVLCALQGTTLTMLLSGQIGTAEDSERLNGEEASYYASAEALETVSNTANATSTLAIQTRSDLITLAGYFKAKTVTATTNQNGLVSLPQELQGYLPLNAHSILGDNVVFDVFNGIYLFAHAYNSLSPIANTEVQFKVLVYTGPVI